MAVEAFNDFEDFLSTTHEELDLMPIGFMKLSVAPITIPIKSGKLIHDLRSWRGDFDHRGMESATAWPGEEVVNADDAFAAMKLARDWEMSCESLKEKKDTTEGPSKFDNTDYEKWRKSLMNQLEICFGEMMFP